MFGKLASYAGFGSSLPFVLDGAAGTQVVAWGGWTHQPGTRREDGAAVSVFRKSAPKDNLQILNAARNGVKRLRMIRHPNILSFVDTVEVEERGETAIYIVTEPVKPLLQVLKELELDGTQRDQYLAMGLYHIAGAVSFLNNDAKVIHGNVCMASVVVTPTLDWKLYGLDFLSEHAMAEQPPNLAAASSVVGPASMHSYISPELPDFLVASQYLPGEVAKSDWNAVSQGPPWAVDAWGTGCLMHEVYAIKALEQIEELRDASCLPSGLVQDYQRLLSSQPARRLNPAKLVSESGFLKNSLVNTVAFLENLSVKDSAEKDQFFRKLPNLLPSFPQSLCVNKFLPLLQRALEYGGAPPIALSAVLKIGNTLAPEEIQARVIPIVTKLFTSQERAIRKSLLENIDMFGPHLTEKVCEEQIFPELSKGFTDSNDYLRELTLRSMLTIGPKLSQRTLNNNLLKYLAKLQVDEKPGIRANTTVLLGNLAPYLGDTACKRVLLNAFTRALKDQFPPARVAALKALVATADKHTPEEAAGRIMPCVMPFVVDPFKDVRKAALQCTDTYMHKLKKHATEMDKRDEDAEAAAAAAGTIVQNSGGAPCVNPAPAKPDESGYLSWAVSLVSSSGSSKTTAAPPAAENGGTGTPACTGGSSSSAPSLSTAHTAQETASSAADGDGWGDDDEPLQGMDQEDEAEKQARERMERLKMKTGGNPKKPPNKPRTDDDLSANVGTAGDGWGSDSGDDLLDDMLAEASKAPKLAPVRPASAKPRPPSAKPKAKPMKLGAQKLGAQKLHPSD